MIKETLQGKPFRHPLHPALVHFPIGLFVLSFLLDLGSYLVSEGPGLVLGSFYAIALGIIMALLAAVPGLIDYSDIRSDHPGKKTATYHMILNLVVVAVFALNLGLRYSDLSAPQTPALPLLLSLIGLGLLGVSGYLGGKLVFDEGIGVGRHRRSTTVPRETLRVSSSTATDKKELSNVTFVSVAETGMLDEQDSLRIDLDGHVIALVKLEGEVFAFQDFCTHRFGPLSEGKLQEGQVQCPWHRSCFDVRTGQVTHGPAKIDLKTYPVQIEDGKVRVGIPRNKTAG